MENVRPQRQPLLLFTTAAALLLMGCPDPGPDEPFFTDEDASTDDVADDTDGMSDTAEPDTAEPDTAEPDTAPQRPDRPWDLEVIAWNVESGEADPDVIETFFSEHLDVGLWGLSEVEYDWAFQFRDALSEGDGDYYFIAGHSGDYPSNDDRLVIIYDTLRFEELDHCELSVVTATDRNSQRVPLVAHMRELASGEEFLFMVNHFQRDESIRLHQSNLLAEWVSGEISQPGCALSVADLPLLAVGDYNLDVDVRESWDDNPWLNALTTTLTWVVPDPLVRSHCAWREMLFDFVFIAGDTSDWFVESEVQTEQSLAVCGWPTDRSSDHRPVFARLWWGL